MLERQLFLHSNVLVGSNAGTASRRDAGKNAAVLSLPPENARYINLDLPPLCSRYANIPTLSSPNGWFVGLLEASREDELLHGSYADLSRSAMRDLAKRNYIEAHDETRAFLNVISERLAIFDGLEPPASSRGTISGEDAEQRPERGACPPVGHPSPAPFNVVVSPPHSISLPFARRIERLRRELTRPCHLTTIPCQP